ncbi:hypothetical protein EDC94DRAFT_598017 [Helicostylum pulchrum]|uniref:GDP/GTP exchange factor Sec2 N-terminal domain-containing protein n=1 Tax=Helicostylum pulchrum TaxID=562976 RepID=A0ABP9XXY4_9FUNG|nr:hypothetical protein EDC94DRAFT_598017 [Helicostylum pulchrum]
MDPVILIDSYHTRNGISVPITLKPLPALLAPPNNFDESPGSFYSPNSSLHVSCSSLSSILKEEDSSLSQPNNSAYYMVIQKQSQEIQDLRQDLLRLNQRYIEQSDRIQIAEQARFQVESELEDLSSRLFEQANEMVSQEKRARYYAEKKATRLETELTLAYQELGDERDQLKELKQKFESDHLLTLSPLNGNNNVPVIHIDQQQQQHQQCMDPTNIYLDDGWLKLFKDFLSLAPITPLDTIHRLPFLKLCLDLDIEPCLRFGNTLKSSRISSKRVLEAIIHEPCFIESETPKKRHSHDDRMLAPKQPVVRRSSFVTNAFKFRSNEETQQQCYGCGAMMNTDLFRFKLKEHDTDWFWIDRACRDRLVAVCDFYVFIRHVRSGLQDQRTIQSLFQECVWLKLCMFWARSGVHHYIKNSSIRSA